MSDGRKIIDGSSRRVVTTVRWVVGIVFITSGIFKIADPGAFYTNLLAYQLGGPDWFYRIVAVILPWIEVLSGVLLLANAWTDAVAAIIAGLCSLFVLALGQALWRGLELKCGCFGGWAPAWLETPGVAFVRASVFLAATGWLRKEGARSSHAILARDTTGVGLPRADSSAT